MMQRREVIPDPCVMSNADLKNRMGKLKREVEKAKRTLSSQMSTRIEIEAFHQGKDFSETLTQAKFEELNNDLFKNPTLPSPWRQDHTTQDTGPKAKGAYRLLFSETGRFPVIPHRAPPGA